MKTWLVIGKVFLSLLASMVGALLGDIIGHDVLNISPDPKSLTIAFIWVLIFPVWYPSKILFRLVATIVGPIVAFLFWSISLAIPIEAGSGMVLLAGGIKAGAFLFTMLVQFIIMRQARVLPVAGTIYSDEKDDLEPEWVNSRDDLEPEDEKDDLEPEWVNSRDDLEPELENNKETQIIDAETVKTAHPWNKKLLIGWGVLSILWVTSMGNILTDFDEDIYDLETVILNVEIDSPRVKKHEDSAYKSKKLDFSGLHWFSIKRLKPDSIELSKAKNKFPHLKGMTNSEFSDHLWGLVQREAIENLAQRKERFESRRLSNYISSVIIPPTTVFILGLIIVCGLRKYPPRAWDLRKYSPSELTPYTKKVIATSAVWVMGAISWFMIEDNRNIDEVFRRRHVLVYILPPLVLIFASVLWKWANKSPTDVPRQSNVD
jgi:hypothetical protein